MGAERRGRILDGGANLVVGAATAQVSGHCIVDLRIGRVWRALQERRGATDGLRSLILLQDQLAAGAHEHREPPRGAELAFDEEETKARERRLEREHVQCRRRLVELRLDSVDGFAVGQEIAVDTLAPGELVDVTAVSRGKGFAGGMKRHNFKGVSASHGAHRNHRKPGSIGASSTPSRVFKGMRMAGRMGGTQVTTLNLVLHSVDAEKGLLLVKGAVPGPKGQLVFVRNAVKGA